MKQFVLVFAILSTGLWLSLPSVAAADNCQNLGENERDRDCSIPEKVFGFFTGLAILAGWTTWKRQGDDSGAEPPEDQPPVPGTSSHLEKDPGNFESQESAYDPGGSNMGGGISGSPN